MDIKNREFFRTLDPKDFERMNLGSRFWGTALANIDDSLEYKETIIKYIDNLGENLTQGKGFLMWGDHGTGKTATATILMKAAVSFNSTYPTLINRAHITTAVEAIGTLWGQDAKAKSDLDYLIRKADMFVLDDLGMERDRGTMVSTVENVIRSRFSSGKSLVVTTNLSNKEMDQRYGKSFIRLLLDGGCFPVKFKHNWRDTKIVNEYPGRIDYE